MFHNKTSYTKKKRKLEDRTGGKWRASKRRKQDTEEPKVMRPLGELARQEEERLEKLVLGDGADLFLEEAGVCSYDLEMEDSGVDEGNSSSSAAMSDTLASPHHQPAWHDEDDENFSVRAAMAAQGRSVPEVMAGGSTAVDSYLRTLKHKFESTMGTPAWAELRQDSSDNDGDGSSDDDSGSEMLRRCGNMISSQSSVLRKGIIEIKRLKDLNHQTYTEGPIIKAVKFHPSATVALVAGLSGIASLFQVDGKTNTKLQSVQFERFPIRCARFTPFGGEQFFVGSQHHGYFHCYDMMVGRSIRMVPSHGLGITNTKNFELSPDGRMIAVAGRFGNIHLLTSNTVENIGLLKMNNEVTAVAFESDGSRLFTYGDGGEIYVWDIANRRCMGRYIDDGSIGGSSMAVAPGGRFIACGSRSGVVNIYETAALLSSAKHSPTPAKILLNLTTPATALQFNASSEIMAMASDEKDNALKLVHTPSMTVFSNFPSSVQPILSRPQCLDFSPGSGFLAIGNNKGMALLYRSHHKYIQPENISTSYRKKYGNKSKVAVGDLFHKFLQKFLVKKK